MSVTDGTYLLTSAEVTTKSLDVWGASDENVARLTLYPSDQTDDAQLVRVITNSDNSRGLCFALSGKMLDAPGIASGTGGINTYDDSGSPLQKWWFVDSGKTATVGGSTLTCWQVLSYYHRDWALSAGDAASSTDGSCVVSATDAALPTGQLWCLVPVRVVSSGQFQMRPVYDDSLCVDVIGESHAYGANVALSAPHDGNNQIFRLFPGTDAGTSMIEAAHSGLLLGAAGDGKTSGANVATYPGNVGDATEMWVLEQDGTTVRNGVTVPTVVLHIQSGNGLVMDCSGAGRDAGTNVQLYSMNGTVAQRFALIPTEVVSSSLPCPTSLLAECPDGTLMGSVPCSRHGGAMSGHTQTVSVSPSWACADGSTSFQCRYRTRTRGGEWGVWHSLADGSTSNSGWGTVGRPNCSGTTERGRFTASNKIDLSVSNTSADLSRLDVEVQARRLSTDVSVPGGISHLLGHGPTLDAQVHGLWCPTLTVGASSFGPDGLLVPVSSDLPTGGNKVSSLVVTGDDGRTICSGLSASGLDATDTVTVPVASLCHWPRDGEVVTVSFAWSTSDLTTSESATSTVSYDASHGIAVSPTYVDEGDGSTVLVTFADADETACWVQVFDGIRWRFEPMPVASRAGGNVTYRCVPPFGSSWHVWMLARDSGTSWGTHDDVRPTLSGRTHSVRWGAGLAQHLSIDAGVGGRPKLSRDFKPDHTDHTTSGGEFPSVSFGRQLERDMPVSGAIVGDVMAGVRATLRLSATGRSGEDVIYRSPWGDWEHVAVEAASCDQESDFHATVSLTLTAVDGG